METTTTPQTGIYLAVCEFKERSDQVKEENQRAFEMNILSASKVETEMLILKKQHLDMLVQGLEGVKVAAQYLERFFLEDYEANRKDSTAKSIAVQILEELEKLSMIQHWCEGIECFTSQSTDLSPTDQKILGISTVSGFDPHSINAFAISAGAGLDPEFSKRMKKLARSRIKKMKEEKLLRLRDIIKTLESVGVDTKKISIETLDSASEEQTPLSQCAEDKEDS